MLSETHVYTVRTWKNALRTTGYTAALLCLLLLQITHAERFTPNLWLQAIAHTVIVLGMLHFGFAAWFAIREFVAFRLEVRPDAVIYDKWEGLRKRIVSVPSTQLSVLNLPKVGLAVTLGDDRVFIPQSLPNRPMLERELRRRATRNGRIFALPPAVQDEVVEAIEQKNIKQAAEIIQSAKNVDYDTALRDMAMPVYLSRWSSTEFDDRTKKILSGFKIAEVVFAAALLTLYVVLVHSPLIVNK